MARLRVLIACVILLLLLQKPSRVEIKVSQTYTYYLPLVVGPSSIRPPASAVSQKKGVGLTHSLCADRFGTWGYDWSGNPPKCAIETVPMAWGGLPGIISDSKWLMGFNEPDLASQSNMTPEYAASLWVDIETIYQDRKLVSPAPSDQHPNWLAQFRSAYIAQNGRAPKLDALGVHCYLWTANDCINLVKQYEAQASVWGVPEIWVTEFSFMTQNQRTQEQAWQEDAKFIQWMESEPMIKRYAFFAARIYGTEPWAFPVGWNTSLLNQDGTLTFWGLRY